MADVTVLPVTLAVAAGVLAAVKRLERSDWTRPLAWLDLVAAVAFGVGAGAVADLLDDGADWWLAAVALFAGFCGFGLLAAVAAFTLVVFPDSEVMTWAVVPLLFGFATQHFLHTTRGSDVPTEWAVRESGRADKRWRLAARVAPVFPFIPVFAVPSEALGDTAWRLIGAALLGSYLMAADRLRVRLLRARRWTITCAELNLALVVAVYAASPGGAQLMRWWARADWLSGWRWYLAVVLAFLVLFAVAWVVGNGLVRGPLLMSAAVVGQAGRLAVQFALLLAVCVLMFNPRSDLLVPAVVGVLPAVFFAWKGISKGRVNRQLGDAALLASLSPVARAQVIDGWVQDCVVRPDPDFSLPDAAGALADQARTDPQAIRPWRVDAGQALEIAEELLAAAGRAKGDERRLVAARGDLELWLARIMAEVDEPEKALISARRAVEYFSTAEADFATALAYAAVVDRAGADPEFDAVAEIDTWLTTPGLLPATRRHALVSAARAALDQGDKATAATRAAAADAIPVNLTAVAIAMRADRVHFGSTPWHLFAIMRHYETQLGPAAPL
ncbi:hypothetical protein GCM10027598_81120 [Amycolatopsis oliviviridis]|uniref:Uncharacterized protein n=1 Tax=Amycolatopsis oliviviridis TaxID=1471590 RepID=A0ABQ3L6S6_9PSEU|nr:hypothetical protein [Amycolatopsis oliviviridis]GHH06125.1 hypothetical protein GCM10017790_11010 [Amycolatopsis oliviviridis]